MEEALLLGSTEGSDSQLSCGVLHHFRQRAGELQKDVQDWKGHFIETRELLLCSKSQEITIDKYRWRVILGDDLGRPLSQKEPPASLVAAEARLSELRAKCVRLERENASLEHLTRQYDRQLEQAHLSSQSLSEQCTRLSQELREETKAHHALVHKLRREMHAQSSTLMAYELYFQAAEQLHMIREEESSLRQAISSTFHLCTEERARRTSLELEAAQSLVSIQCLAISEFAANLTVTNASLGAVIAHSERLLLERAAVLRTALFRAWHTRVGHALTELEYELRHHTEEQQQRALYELHQVYSLEALESVQRHHVLEDSAQEWACAKAILELVEKESVLRNSQSLQCLEEFSALQLDVLSAHEFVHRSALTQSETASLALLLSCSEMQCRVQVMTGMAFAAVNTLASEEADERLHLARSYLREGFSLSLHDSTARNARTCAVACESLCRELVVVAEQDHLDLLRSLHSASELEIKERTARHHLFCNEELSREHVVRLAVAERCNAETNRIFFELEVGTREAEGGFLCTQLENSQTQLYSWLEDICEFSRYKEKSHQVIFDLEDTSRASIAWSEHYCWESLESIPAQVPRSPSLGMPPPTVLKLPLSSHWKEDDEVSRVVAQEMVERKLQELRERRLAGASARSARSSFADSPPEDQTQCTQFPFLGIEITEGIKHPVAEFTEFELLGCRTRPPEHTGLRIFAAKGPAAMAGLLTGDGITHVNGITVHSAQEFSEATHHLTPGDIVALSVLRDGRRLNFTFICEARDSSEWVRGQRNPQKKRVLLPKWLGGDVDTVLDPVPRALRLAEGSPTARGNDNRPLASQRSSRQPFLSRVSPRSPTKRRGDTSDRPHSTQPLSALKQEILALDAAIVRSLEDDN
eukprot:TRINITY_DN11934_c0_g1_i1.p1 TRINITY_DN11934_c0_g1~~TRINITY_DN11934_c0_g1_i1.p1  ORF type:complete len:885 (-),score=133.50 TRINITY_DN11934_c0_g1_i1:38-2671(-)